MFDINLSRRRFYAPGLLLLAFSTPSLAQDYDTIQLDSSRAVPGRSAQSTPAAQPETDQSGSKQANAAGAERPQDSAPDDADESGDDDSIEEVIVTGTRIPRDPNIGSDAPVQSVNADDILLSGEADIGEILNDIPALLSSNTASNSVSGIFGTGSGETGAASVGETVLTLRGLGVERTLVLVDGRRHVSGVGGSQAVDVGTIPDGLIERVEVLTGGASAIYGADAVSGVVNFILKKDYEGFEVKARGGLSSKGDGELFSLNGLFGTNFDNDRGNLTVAIDLTRREEIRAGDRGFSRNNGVADDLPNPALRFQVGDISPDQTPNFARFYDPSTSFSSDEDPCNLFGINECFGFFNRGFRIPDQDTFLRLWHLAFPGEPDPNFTDAELALIERAATSPTRLIHSQPNFSLTAPGGVILPGGVSLTGVDLDGNGTDDCLDSYQGFISTFDFSPPGFGMIGGCWIVQDDGTVRPLRDGLIAGDINQFGEDGIANTFDEDFIIPQDKKATINITSHYDISKDVTAFTEFKYAYQGSHSGGPLNTFYDLLTVAPDNPYIDQLPPALAAVGREQGLFITRDPADLGPNIDKNIRQTYRIVGGLRGTLPNGWNFEVNGNYGRFRLTARDRNRVIVDRFFAAIDAIADPVTGEPICRSDIDPTAPPTTPFGIPAASPGFFTFNPGDGSCRPANLLGGRGAISQDAIDFFTQTVVNKFTTQQVDILATVTGDSADFFTLPAGPIGFSFGGEYRDEISRSRFDPLVRGVAPVTTPNIDAGTLVNDNPSDQSSLVFDSGSLIQDSGGSFDVWELFAEFSVPLLEDAPFAEELTADAAIRYSHYSTVGQTVTWKTGGTWTPIRDIRFRGGYSVAIRAPNIQELFSPDQGAFFRPIDPCDQSEIDALIAIGDPRGPIRAANCLAAGIPVGFVDPLTARFVGVTSGNQNLREEKAKTYTVGVVIQSRFSEGLSLTVDYWNIQIRNAIQSVSAQDIVNNCFDSIDPNNQFCDLFARNDDPNSPQFHGFNFLRQTELNFAALETQGIDFTATYEFDLEEYSFLIRASGTRVYSLNNFFDPSDPTAKDPELGELQRPKWAGNINASVRRGPVRVNWQTQYLGKQALRSVEIETADVIFGPAGISSQTTIHDISFSYDWSEQIQIFGGVNNLSDEKPFITELAFPVSPVGRFFFFGVSMTSI